MGSICKTRCPVAAIQSTIVLRSPKSPTPWLPSLRKENTGIAVPAMRGARASKYTSTSGRMWWTPFSGVAISKRRLSPLSQCTTRRVPSSTATNLYSQPLTSEVASSVNCHTPGAISSKGIAAYSSHAPSEGVEPRSERCNPFLRKPGESTRKATLQCANEGEGAPGKVECVTAEENSALSCGRSRQRSSTR